MRDAGCGAPHPASRIPQGAGCGLRVAESNEIALLGFHRYTHVLTEEKYSREVVVIPIDFSDGMEIYPNIAEQLNDLDIGVLGMQLAKIYHSA